jgi:hypothetical protein
MPTNTQIVRSAAKLLEKCADVMEVIFNKGGDRLLGDDRKSIGEFVQALKSTAAALKPISQFLEESPAIKAWNKGTAQALKDSQPTKGASCPQNLSSENLPKGMPRCVYPRGTSSDFGTQKESAISSDGLTPSASTNPPPCIDPRSSPSATIPPPSPLTKSSPSEPTTSSTGVNPSSENPSDQPKNSKIP